MLEVESLWHVREPRALRLERELELDAHCSTESEAARWTRGQPRGDFACRAPLSPLVLVVQRWSVVSEKETRSIEQWITKRRHLTADSTRIPKGMVQLSSSLFIAYKLPYCVLCKRLPASLAMSCTASGFSVAVISEQLERPARRRRIGGVEGG